MIISTGKVYSKIIPSKLIKYISDEAVKLVKYLHYKGFVPSGLNYLHYKGFVTSGLNYLQD